MIAQKNQKLKRRKSHENIKNQQSTRWLGFGGRRQ
jgi:hypothetical protein